MTVACHFCSCQNDTAIKVVYATKITMKSKFKTTARAMKTKKHTICARLRTQAQTIQQETINDYVGSVSFLAREKKPLCFRQFDNGFETEPTVNSRRHQIDVCDENCSMEKSVSQCVCVLSLPAQLTKSHIDSERTSNIFISKKIAKISKQQQQGHCTWKRRRIAIAILNITDMRGNKL